MSTMNVSLPADLKAYVDQRVAADAYGSSSEFIRELIRRDQDVQRFRGLIVEAMESTATGVADAAYFDALRDRVRARGGS